LPSYRQAFGHFLYLQKDKKMTVREASCSTVRTVVVLAEIRDTNKSRTALNTEAGICVHSMERSSKKQVQKTDNQSKLEQQFVSRLDDLLDIAHADAHSLIKLPEDRMFLLRQREKSRPGTFGSVDSLPTQG